VNLSAGLWHREYVRPTFRIVNLSRGTFGIVNLLRGTFGIVNRSAELSAS